jgi:hypothetical protein
MIPVKKNSRFTGSISLIFSVALALGSSLVGSAHAQIPVPVGSSGAIVSVFVPGGMNYPRGLKFGPDGDLYVAEAGYPTGTLIGAPTGLGGNCSTGNFGPGEYFGSTTGSRILKIDTQ